MKQVRSDIVQENPKAKAVDVTKLIAQKWEKIESKEKLKFEEEFKKDQEKYIEEKLEYDSKLTAEDREKITNVRREIDSKRKRQAKRNKCKEFKKPKKSPSAFVLWMLEQYPTRGAETFRTFQLRVAQQWKSMADSERKPYIDRSKEMNEKYKEELTQWEEKMIRLGNIDIVRNDSKVLKIPSKTKRQHTPPPKSATQQEIGCPSFTNQEALPQSLILSENLIKHAEKNWDTGEIISERNQKLDKFTVIAPRAHNSSNESSNSIKQSEKVIESNEMSEKNTNVDKLMNDVSKDDKSPNNLLKDDKSTDNSSKESSIVNEMLKKFKKFF